MVKRKKVSVVDSDGAAKTDVSGDQDTKKEILECTICLGEPDELGMLQCHHSFCYNCIFSWSKRENTCPLCKERFTSIEKLAKGTVSNPKKKKKVSVKAKSQGDDIRRISGPFIFGGPPTHYGFNPYRFLFQMPPFFPFDDDNEVDDYNDDIRSTLGSNDIDQILNLVFSGLGSSSTSDQDVVVIDEDEPAVPVRARHQAPVEIDLTNDDDIEDILPSQSTIRVPAISSSESSSSRRPNISGDDPCDNTNPSSQESKRTKPRRGKAST